MRMKPLGPSGLFVSELCLGTMTFGGGDDDMWGKIGQLEQEQADTLVKTALDAGINFIDTANVYAGGRSERILGQALKNLGVDRDEVVVATKVMGGMGDGPNMRGTSRRHIMSQVRQSLDRLQMDHIDLYQIHGFDPATPIEETLAALNTLVEHGHVRYIGLSNWAAWQIVKAIGITRARDYAPILSLQAYYTLVGRDLEREIVPMLKSEGLGLMVWSPLAGGYLSGKYAADGTGGDGRRAEFDFPPVDFDRGAKVLDAMKEIAGAKGASMPQIALAWLLHQEAVTSVIVGAKRVEQLQDNIGATEVSLSEADLDRLGEASQLPPEYPGWMFQVQGADRTRD
ncbi:aldo/keto reductase [Histidinibacterium aquaticum]|uniref:Aldo/keto reductase n=1 Tax=Histidinibacterium aquaticum TaxID=2613962 RepID=A0A5J5GJ29_9RHOB|nr:aldo/keto reductase [Histidinibacterium aquaticum]KAA9008155.1 aldo/keto reductase [Histidinibacterium aquaticum]